jgi:hypothetical protein
MKIVKLIAAFSIAGVCLISCSSICSKTKAEQNNSQSSPYAKEKDEVAKLNSENEALKSHNDTLIAENAKLTSQAETPKSSNSMRWWHVVSIVLAFVLGGFLAYTIKPTKKV